MPLDLRTNAIVLSDGTAGVPLVEIKRVAHAAHVRTAHSHRRTRR